MKPFRGIVRGRYAIATYLKPELTEALDSYLLQEIGKKAIQEAVRIREDDAIAVPIEKVKKTLENTVRKVIYVDRETHEKWVEFPKILKDYLHYWVNVKFEQLRSTIPKEPIKEPKEKNKDMVLAFYLYGKVYELYQQGLLNGKVVLDSLLEVYEEQDELNPLRNIEYNKVKKTLGGAGKVFLNFKHHPELRDWYVDLAPAKRKAVWIATHYKLLDKLSKVWYNILYQNQ
jgi:hypothetical protein